MSGRMYVFKRFERFWHWSQAGLIIFMMLTGFEIHGVYTLFGFRDAVLYHGVAAWTLIALWVFAIFWHFTTGEWKQYIPSFDRLLVIARYYAWNIFAGAPHPYHPTPLRKHNPLQRLAYLGVKLIINPLIWVSGLLYLYYPMLRDGVLAEVPLAWVATAHFVGALLMLIFFVTHVYLTTTGQTVFAHIRAMITGWEEGDADPVAEAGDKRKAPRA
ncbi:MAG: cytochrome b/b6 domain-containing protein [Thiotrichales bacterium]